MKLDDIDKSILRILQKDAKISMKEVGEKVNLSSTPVFQRVKRLEKLGIIESYSAIINTNKIESRIIVFAEVNLKIHKQSELDDFEETMRNMPEILECYHITGKFDYLLKISIPNMSEYRTFIMDKMSRVKSIDSFNSSITMKEIKKEQNVFF